MNIRIAHRKCALAIVAALVMLSTVARAQNPHAGTWETSELTIKGVTAECLYVETVTATFHLAAGINNAVAGYLTRRFERSWWLTNPGCVLPGVDGNPGFTLRQDNWAVTGEPQGRDTQRLKGVYAGCTTHCNEAWNPPGTFEIELVRRPAGMSGGFLKGIVGPTMYRDSYQSQLDSANASGALMKLVQPLLEGRCDEFLLRSMDEASKRRVSRDVMCAFGTQLRLLIPTVIRHEKSQAHSATLAQVQGAHGPLLLSEGDVLVKRFLVVTIAGDGVFFGAALRKQTDGSWRVLDIVR